MIGQLVVSVLAGRSLAAKDLSGTSDPYCILTVHQQQHKTKVIPKTLNPVWEKEDYVFDILTKDDAELKVMMYDRDLIGKDDFMGKLVIKLYPSQYEDGKPREVVFPLEQDDGKYKGEKVSGDLKLRIKLVNNTAVAGGGSNSNSSHGGGGGGGGSEGIFSSDDVGKLWIQIIEGKDLAAKDVTGKSDPYCILQMVNQTASQVKKTKVIEQNLNPVWEHEEHVFDIIGIAKTSELLIQMFDEDRIGTDDFMGRAKIKIFPDLEDEEVKERIITLEKDDGKYKKEVVSGTLKVKIQMTLYALDPKLLHEYFEFRDVLFQSNSFTFRVVKVLLDVCTERKDELAQSIVRASESISVTKTNDLVQSFIEEELGRTVQKETLFRVNSHATRLMNGICRSGAGLTFLKNVVTPILQQIQKDPTKFEIDPTRCSKPSAATANADHLATISRSLVASLINNVGSIPIRIKEMATMLSQMVEVKFPGCGRIAVAGFFILRFINPGLFSLSTDADPLTHRAIVLLSKVIQNLANSGGTAGGGGGSDKKEAYMAPLKTKFVAENSERFNKFLDDISSCPFPLPATTPPFIPAATSPQDKAVLSRDIKFIHRTVTANNNFKTVKANLGIPDLGGGGSGFAGGVTISMLTVLFRMLQTQE